LPDAPGNVTTDHGSMNSNTAAAASADLAVEPAIHTRDLTKRYGDMVAVDHVSITVRRGEVYGFLGPNGAGKTTTMRMLLGLVRKTSGEARVVGVAPGDPRGLAATGSVVEGPAFYPYLTGRENLLVVARQAGVAPSRVDRVLDRLDMTAAGRRRFGGYSMGMKQRLGLAAAVLKDPVLLILDEPTNGLDPVGVAELRGLLGEFAGEGRAVFLSSHQLGEVEQTCDRVGVIVGGRMVREGSLDEIRGHAGLVVVATPIEAAAARLRERFGADRVDVARDQIALDADAGQAADVNRDLVSHGVDVREVRRQERSLEEVFLALTHAYASGPRPPDAADEPARPPERPA
jgi:ABC-2 type transport system ATP-binding protein